MIYDYGVVRVRPATQSDVESLAPRLRPADKQELEAQGVEPLEALQRGLDESLECYAAETPTHGCIALFGVAKTHEPNLGAIWLLGSPELNQIKTTFLRHSKVWVNRLFGTFHILGNWCDERNTLHVRWLKWLGCRFLQRVPYGPTHFLEFVLMKE